MKILFMGTPDFAVAALDSLYNSKHEIVAVVTQPDKPKGRSGKLAPPPVKEKALELGLEVIQPQRVKDDSFMELLVSMEVDVIVVIAFGQILPKRVLEYPKYGCINIHASLLPKYRGAAPIQWSIIDGEKVTGVTTMQMNEGLDTGDIIEQVEVEISEKETGGSLFDRLMDTGAELILSTLEKVENGTAKFVPQDDEKSSYAKILNKQLGELDFTKSAAELERLIRGLNPWPSAYTHLNGKTLKIWDANVCEDNKGHLPGKIFDIEKSGFKISTASGALSVTELQLEGKKRMKSDEFLRGYKLEECILGSH